MESHQKNIKIAVSEALSLAGLKDASEIDGIAVTRGPGLEICLRVGIEEAKVIFPLPRHNELIAPVPNLWEAIRDSSPS